MTSTFMGIEIGKRAVMTHSQALHTVGQNLANAETEGYSRQRVDMTSSDPIYAPGMNRSMGGGQIGQGVKVAEIIRYEDMLLEGRIVEKGGEFGFWSTREKWLSRVQSVYNETSGNSVRHAMDQFFNSWNELANSPENLEFRHNVVSQSQTLMDRLNETYNIFNDMRSDINTEVSDTVRHVNELTKNIAAISDQIVQVEAMGDNPNDLKDRRDQLTRELSELVNIEVEYRDPDEFTLTVDGKTLVQGKQFQLLRAIEDPQNQGLARVIWDYNGSDFTSSGGSLASLVDLRDGDLRDEIQKLDTLAISFVDQVNEIHSKSYDLQGNTGRSFFQEFDYVNNVRGSFDNDGDGQFDTSIIFRMTGNNRLDPKSQLGFEGVLTLNADNEEGFVIVPYNTTDTVDQVINRINQSGAEVLAGLNSDGRLILRASSTNDTENPDFVIRHVEDSGEFLVGFAGVLNQSGEEGAYDWDWDVTGGDDSLNQLVIGEDQIQVSPLRNPSGWIRINEEIVNDVSKLAAAEGVYGGSSGQKNGTSAMLIAELNNRGPMVGQKKGYREFFSDMIADAGSKTRRAIENTQTELLFLDQMTTEKLAITGVNMDEELTNMLKFQHGYSAASRFITEIDKMLDIIINRMGV